MTEQELNERRARWAGFYIGNGKTQYCYRLGKRVPAWLTPTGTISFGAIGRGSIPDFTDDLNACFKYFKSKFTSMACGSLNEADLKGAWAKVITHEGRTAWAREENIEPAQALCQAIDKLIDSEVKA